MKTTSKTRTSFSDQSLSDQPLVRLLESYAPADADEEAVKKQLLQFLAMTDNAYCRSNLVAHVVADAWVINPGRSHVVLVEHAQNKKWMAPGGHCDGDPDIFAAALREIHEEAGLTGLKPLLDGQIFDIRTGHVPTRMKNGVLEPEHLHFDVCFAFEAPENAPLTISDESTGLDWVRLSDIQNINFHPRHLPRVEKTLKGKL